MTTEAWIDASEGVRIHVDQFDDRVWFSLRNDSASMRVIISKESAKELVQALNNVINHIETVEQ